jgi:citrate lyase beta subunit
MKESLSRSDIEKVFSKLQDANNAFNKIYPGELAARQPVHTVYGGAQLFKADSGQKLGQMSIKSMEAYAPDFVVFAKALQLPGYQHLKGSAKDYEGKSASKSDACRDTESAVWLAKTVYSRVKEKLKNEAVEDFRIDFEDGYGNRPDPEEDKHAELAALEVAKGMEEGILPPFIGIRIKPFNEELKHRSARTLDIFTSTLLEKTGGKLPDNFVITLPKVTIAEQVTAFVQLLQLIEQKTGLRPGTLKLELMVEQPQTIINHKGECTIPYLIEASDGRCTAAHFGTYDYTASCNITAHHQSMDHPACDFARHMMKVSLAGTGIWLSDGATNVMPVGPHREGDTGLTATQREENAAVVHHAWKLSYDHIQHSLRNAFYQGWDLHPAQLPIRYAACYTFFLEGLQAASLRLKTFMEKAAQATLVGDVFDDAATGQGLLNYFLRALNCGAITLDEVQATGLTLEEIRSRSFVKILNARAGKEKIHA